MTNVTCRLTAKKPGSALCPMLIIDYGTTLLFYTSTVIYNVNQKTHVNVGTCCPE